MGKYIENPKLKGSGLMGCIPQKGECPRHCSDCFFQGGRGYLEPLSEKTPNMPTIRQTVDRVVRVNDGNDSSIDCFRVENDTRKYRNRFYNTSSIVDIRLWPAPVVVTVNPDAMTDIGFHKICEVPDNLMMVRVRTNTWNLGIVDCVVDWYTVRGVAVVLTFMAYFEGAKRIPADHRANYILRKRTMNEYTAVTTEAWREVMRRYEGNILVSSCGKIEGEWGNTSCRYCGVCLREYFACRERMRGGM